MSELQGKKFITQEPCDDAISREEEVKEVERRYEATIDKMHQLVDRLKTERMSQAEFEQYAKEHGYIISTTNIIEQIRAEIEQTADEEQKHDEKWAIGLRYAVKIIDRYTK